MRAVVALLVVVGIARAVDVSLPGTLLLVKPGKVVRIVAKAAPGTPFVLPDPDQVTGAAGALRVADLGAFPSGADDTYPLPHGWKTIGKPAHITGFRYRGAGTADDPCTLVLLKKTIVKMLCTGSAVALVPPFTGEVGVVLTIGSTGDQYCATFGGKGVKNRTGLLKRTGAAAVPCPSVIVSTTSTTTSTTTATTVTTVTLPPGPHLMINEVDYDQVGADTREFVEIYNPMSAPAVLTGLALVFVDGLTGAEYYRVDLGLGGPIPAGECLMVGPSAITVPPSAVKLSPDAFEMFSNVILNGAPDGIALLDTATNLLLDRFSYEGAITAASINGVPGTVDLVEGTMLPANVADSNTVAGSLIRYPSGTDTDDASNDWTFTTTPTPGAPNIRTQ